jgi:hypothetical protein
MSSWGASVASDVRISFLLSLHLVGARHSEPPEPHDDLAGFSRSYRVGWGIGAQNDNYTLSVSLKKYI